LALIIGINVNMTTEHKMLEKVRVYIRQLPSDFAIIYMPVMKLLPFKLKWRAAAGRQGASREDVEKIATRYIKLATHCYLHKKTLALSERLSGSKSKVRQWGGLTFPVAEDSIPGPTNSIGQGWWIMVIGNGPLRDAGYALVARVAAKSRAEIDNHVAAIGAIIKE
jgi:hypothetical protein